MASAIRHFGRRRRGPRTTACDRVVVRYSPAEAAITALLDAPGEGFHHRTLIFSESDIDTVRAAPRHAEAWGLTDATADAIRRVRSAAESPPLTALFDRLPTSDEARELVAASPDHVRIEAEAFGAAYAKRITEVLHIFCDGGLSCTVTGWPACALHGAGLTRVNTERLESRWRIDLRGKPGFAPEFASLETPNRQRFMRTEACRACGVATACDGVSMLSLEAGPMPIPRPIRATPAHAEAAR